MLSYIEFSIKFFNLLGFYLFQKIVSSIFNDEFAEMEYSVAPMSAKLLEK